MYSRTGSGVAAAVGGSVLYGSLALVAAVLVGGALTVLAVSWRRRRRDRSDATMPPV